MSKNEKKLEVQVGTLALIQQGVAPVVHKVNSLLEGHYKGEYCFGDRDLLVIMELKVSSEVLNSYLKEMLDEAYEASVDTITVAAQEVQTITVLAQNIALASVSNVGLTSLVDN